MPQKLTLTAAPGSPADSATQRASAGAAIGAALDLDKVYVEVGGSINSIREEVDDACKDMNTFHNREPDETMRLCAGHSARLSEIRIRIQRVEDFHRQWKNIRTRELEPCLDQLRLQFDIASRLHTVRMDDWRMETGQR